MSTHPAGAYTLAKTNCNWLRTCVAADHRQTTATQPDAGSPSSAVGVVVADTTAVTPDTATIDTASATVTRTLKKTPVSPASTQRVKQEIPTDSPAAVESESEPEKAVEKPVPVVCDQVVMHNGDLTDAKILEVGVSEIRYRKCNRNDGSEYVVPKSDVLSIRCANGDGDRF